PFTEKCRMAAATSGTALVATVDLFWPVQYLVSNQDAEYAAACRGALLSITGRVTFPAVPVVERPEGKNQDEKGR
ncbi:MAG: hypothetical protein ACHQ1G_14010, partial [Planctomycetota bacterium]